MMDLVGGEGCVRGRGGGGGGLKKIYHCDSLNFDTRSTQAATLLPSSVHLSDSSLEIECRQPRDGRRGGLQRAKRGEGAYPSTLPPISPTALFSYLSSAK